VRHADIAGHRARPRRLDRLLHRLPRAHAFEHNIGADAVGQFLDPRRALLATLGDNA